MYSQDIIVKTLIATSPQLSHSYSACRPGKGADEKSQCFEILGFDILLDEGLNPWLLEVNTLFHQRGCYVFKLRNFKL